MAYNNRDSRDKGGKRDFGFKGGRSKFSDDKKGKFGNKRYGENKGKSFGKFKSNFEDSSSDFNNNSYKKKEDSNLDSGLDSGNSRGYSRNSSREESNYSGGSDRDSRSSNYGSSSRSFGGRSSSSGSRFGGESRSGGSSYGGGSRGGRSSGGFGGRSSSGSSRFGGSRGGRSGGGAGKRSQYIDEAKFVQKAQPISENKEYVSSFKFPDLDIHPTLKKNIVAKGYHNPTPIQDQTIPHIIDGKDLLGIANTGTGKTVAFLLPLIQKMVNSPKSKALVIVPTRELAQQINEELLSLTKMLNIYSVQCTGGVSSYGQVREIRKGFNFIIGTPGRLKDLVQQRALNLSQFNFVVLDEVDRMLDMGFIDHIKELISYLSKERQSLFFSATLDSKIERVIDMLLKKDFMKVSVKTSDTSKNVDQDIIYISSRDEKVERVIEMLGKEEFERVLIFVNTKREVDTLNKELAKLGFDVESIHGDKRQTQRDKAISKFKAGKVKVLIATDVAARGLDISNVSHVINYDIPNTYQDYVHRIGRTGRANKAGKALTFVQKGRR